MKRTILLLITTMILLIIIKHVNAMQVVVLQSNNTTCNIGKMNVIGFEFLYANITCYKDKFTKEITFNEPKNLFVIHKHNVVSYCNNCSRVKVISYDDLLFDIDNKVVYRGNRELISIVRPEVHSFLFEVAYFNNNPISYIITLVMYFVYLMRYIFTGKLREKIIEEGVVFVMLILIVYVLHNLMDPFSAFVSSFILISIIVTMVIIFTYTRE